MTQKGLLAIEQATIGWQQMIQSTQQVTATTVDQMSNFLMKIYQDTEAALDHLMDERPGSGASNYSTKVQIWETNFNKVSQGWSNEQSTIKTPVDSDSQGLQSLGNDSQEASNIVSKVTEVMGTLSNLLQSVL